MYDNTRKLWDDMVAQARVHLQGDCPLREDALIIDVDSYLRSQDKRIAELTMNLEILQSRSMPKDEQKKLVGKQLGLELFVPISDKL